MKGIDPKYIMYLGLLVTIEQAIGHGTVSLTNLVPASWAPYITSWCNFLAFIGTSIMTYQAAISGPQTGPLVNMPSVTPTIVKVLIAAFVLSMFLAGGPVFAAPRHSAVKSITGDALPCDPANLLPGCKEATTDAAGNPVTSLLSKPMQDLANFIAAGFDDAVTLSTEVPELQDGNGQACWSMMKNYSAVLKDHPIPATLHLAADLEAIRLLNMAANKICQNSACTQVFTDAGNLVNAAAPIGMPLPNLTALCSKVPEIAVVAPSPSPSPVTSASPAASPSPTPSPTPSTSPTP